MSNKIDLEEVFVDPSNVTGPGLMMQAVFDALRLGYDVNLSCDKEGWINAELHAPVCDDEIMFGDGRPILKVEKDPSKSDKTYGPVCTAPETEFCRNKVVGNKHNYCSRSNCGACRWFREE